MSDALMRLEVQTNIVGVRQMIFFLTFVLKEKSLDATRNRAN